MILLYKCNKCKSISDECVGNVEVFLVPLSNYREDNNFFYFGEGKKGKILSRNCLYCYREKEELNPVEVVEYEECPHEWLYGTYTRECKFCRIQQTGKVSYE